MCTASYTGLEAKLSEVVSNKLHISARLMNNAVEKRERSTSQDEFEDTNERTRAGSPQS